MKIEHAHAEYELLQMNLSPFNKFSWLFDELSDNKASNNVLSLSVSVAVNKNLRSDSYVR